MISVHFQGKPFSITEIQVYALTSNAEEAEVEWFYEDLQDFLELTPKKDVLFIIGDWNAKVGSQETPGVSGKFVLGVQNEAGQRLMEFCQENTLVLANTLFQQHKRRLYTETPPKEKKCKKAKWLSEKALQIAVNRRKEKNKGEKKRYTHLNAEFQRVARRDKKAFLSGQCKEIEENNRMGKTTDLF